jgi:hypothetical protein
VDQARKTGSESRFHLLTQMVLTLSDELHVTPCEANTTHGMSQNHLREQVDQARKTGIERWFHLLTQMVLTS